MFKNPFTPIFGGKPGIFFGRQEILARFDGALIDKGSDDRALFITGTRGSGKTALLEKLSQRAKHAGWAVIDLGPDETLETLARSLVRHRSATRTVSPQASISVAGMGGSFSAGSISKTTVYDSKDLQLIMLERCEHDEHGLFVTIDEAQKVSSDEMSSICNAFQMASRKGYDVMLAIAGLPDAYERIIRIEGCTFMRRAPRIQLGLFSWSETDDSLKKAFARIPGIVVPQDRLDELNEASYGHPYLMQLLGYHLIVELNAHGMTAPHEVDSGEAQKAVERAVIAYKQRALRPLLDELIPSEVAYLKAMGAVMARDGERFASTSAVSKQLGKSLQQLSTTRERLINSGIIAVPARGSVMFTVPYLRTYSIEHEPDDAVTLRAIERGV